MTLIGYMMMCEQAGPKQLVRDVALAEQAGFDFAVISNHYFLIRRLSKDRLAARVLAKAITCRACGRPILARC